MKKCPWNAREILFLLRRGYIVCFQSCKDALVYGIIKRNIDKEANDCQMNTLLTSEDLNGAETDSVILIYSNITYSSFHFKKKYKVDAFPLLFST
jgi:hypothetical protein